MPASRKSKQPQRLEDPAIIERHDAEDISFKVSRMDTDCIRKIVARGWKIDWLRKSYDEKLSMSMDVTAVHANGNPLRLQALLDADDFNFAHDMSGICNCLDRNTGKLTRNFRPRFSRREDAADAPRAAIAGGA